LDLPEIHGRTDLLTALTTIAGAVANGDLTTAQSDTLTRMLIKLQQATW
jgi:hypothetical protein